MRRVSQLLCLFLAIFVAILVRAESKNAADYPLRLHIYTSSEVTFYHNHFPEESRGDGRANLFENGAPLGVDFSFDCPQKLKDSFGFDTYPAKWKKKGEQLIVLFPVFGKSNAFFTCTLSTHLKDSAYFLQNGRLTSEAPERFKAWMISHDYDPERGKNTPRFTTGAVAFSPLDEARASLTGIHKDTQTARKLLLEIVQQADKTQPDAETLAWANIYLGYIEDLAKNRQAAIGWYQKALAVQGASSGSINLAKYGLQRPLVWIRHLDSPPQPANSSYTH